MFKTCCGDCGECWYVGNPRTCTCPDETTKRTRKMNANELADELAFKHIAGDDSGAFSSKIITMLRQQQESIEGLTRDYDLLFAEHQLLLKNTKGQE